MRASHTIRLDVLILGWSLVLFAQGCTPEEGSDNPVASGPVTVPLTVAVDGTAADGAGLAAKDGVADVVSTSGVIEVLHVDGPLRQIESVGIWEFDLQPVNVDINEALFALAVDDDNGPFPFNLAIYGYAGDGEVTGADFTAGALLGTLSYVREPAIGIDVTAFIRERLTAGDRWAGLTIRFSPASTIDTNGPFVTFGALEGGPGPALLLLEVP